MNPGRVILACLAALILPALMGCLFAGRASGKGAQVSSELDAAVRAAWKGIGSSESRCGEFDYFPGGGMRNYYCHLLNYMEYKRFVQLVGVPVYANGPQPHSSGGLVLDSRFSFGRYNPEFVARLGNICIPGERDSAFHAATQGIYDEFVRPLARVFFVTYRKLMDNPAFLVQEKNEYLLAIRNRTLEPYYYEKYFDFLSCEYPYYGKNRSDFKGPGFEGICDGNVVKTCVAFWIRRSIDGTDDEFYSGLERLLKVYDGAFLNSFAPLPGVVK